MIVILRRLLVRPYLPKRMQLMEVASYSESKIDKSFTQLKLQQLNKAIAATMFITNMIGMANNKQKLEDNGQNLSNKILKDIQSFQGLELTQAAKSLRDMFDPKKGMNLEPYYRIQKRIIQGSNEQNVFCFFPNRMITPNMFSAIQNFKAGLLYGRPGMAKTVSILLYAQLSNIVSEYRFSSKENNDKYNYMVYKLREKGVQLKTPFKIIYLTLHKTALTSQLYDDFIKQLDFRDFDSAPYGQYKLGLLRKCHTKYQAQGVPCKIMFDQINNLVALCRKLNKKIQNKQSFEEDQDPKSVREKLSLTERFFSSPFLTILNSSVNIEDSLLLKQQDDPFHLGFLNDHEKLHKHKVKYPKNISHQSMKREILHIALFELKRNAPEQLCREIKDKESQILGGLEQNFTDVSITHLQLREILEKNKEVFQLKTISDIGKKLIHSLPLIEKQKVAQAKIKMGKFIKNGSFQNRAKKVQLLAAISEYIKNKSQSNQLDLNKILLIPKQDWGQINFKEKGDVNSSVPDGDYLDKEMFEIEDHEISCILTAEQVLELSYQMKQRFFKPFLQNSELAKVLLELIEGRAIIGSMYETAVKLLLLFKVPSEFNFNNNRILQTNKCVTFKQLNRVFSKNNQQSQVCDRLKDVFSSRAGQMVVGIPVTVDGYQTRQTNNPSFDFIIANHFSQKDYVVYSIDITVGLSQQNIKTKIKNAKERIPLYMKPLQESGKYSIKQWNHIIIGPTSVSFPQQVVDHKFKIQFQVIQTMKIQLDQISLTNKKKEKIEAVKASMILCLEKIGLTIKPVR